MEYIIVLIIGFCLGGQWTLHKVRKQIYEIAKEKGIVLDEDEVPKIQKIPHLEIEKHGNTLYLFEHKSNTFMCQGSSIDELAQKLVTYQNIDVAFVQHDNKNFWFIKGKVELNPNES